MYLLTEWDGRMGIYLARPRDIQTEPSEEMDYRLRLLGVRCRLIKFFVDYLVPYLWTMGEKKIAKFHLLCNLRNRAFGFY